jgi:hypothetical protein
MQHEPGFFPAQVLKLTVKGRHGYQTILSNDSWRVSGFEFEYARLGYLLRKNQGISPSCKYAPNVWKGERKDY